MVLTLLAVNPDAVKQKVQRSQRAEDGDFVAQVEERAYHVYTHNEYGNFPIHAFTSHIGERWASLVTEGMVIPSNL